MSASCSPRSSGFVCRPAAAAGPAPVTHPLIRAWFFACPALPHQHAATKCVHHGAAGEHRITQRLPHSVTACGVPSQGCAGVHGPAAAIACALIRRLGPVVTAAGCALPQTWPSPAVSDLAQSRGRHRNHGDRSPVTRQPLSTGELIGACAAVFGRVILCDRCHPGAVGLWLRYRYDKVDRTTRPSYPKPAAADRQPAPPPRV